MFSVSQKCAISYNKFNFILFSIFNINIITLYLIILIFKSESLINFINYSTFYFFSYKNFIILILYFYTPQKKTTVLYRPQKVRLKI